MPAAIFIVPRERAPKRRCRPIYDVRHQGCIKSGPGLAGISLGGGGDRHVPQRIQDPGGADETMIAITRRESSFERQTETRARLLPGTR